MYVKFTDKLFTYWLSIIICYLYMIQAALEWALRNYSGLYELVGRQCNCKARLMCCASGRIAFSEMRSLFCEEKLKLSVTLRKREKKLVVWLDCNCYSNCRIHVKLANILRGSSQKYLDLFGINYIIINCFDQLQIIELFWLIFCKLPRTCFRILIAFRYYAIKYRVMFKCVLRLIGVC